MATRPPASFAQIKELAQLSGRTLKECKDALNSNELDMDRAAAALMGDKDSGTRADTAALTTCGTTSDGGRRQSHGNGGWHGRRSALSRLDMLGGVEARALQQGETELLSLFGELLVSHRAVETALDALGALPTSTAAIASASSVALAELPPSGVPAALRPHLRWLMRCLVTLRMPPILSRLLGARDRLHGDASANAALTRSVHAIFNVQLSSDSARLQSVLIGLWEEDLGHQLERLSASMAPTSAPTSPPAGAEAAGPLRAIAIVLHPSGLLAQLLRSHLQRQLPARRFLHERCGACACEPR
jgi:hypothetical protein